MTRMQIRLCAMMFLQFFIWGGWFVTMGSFLATSLAATGAQIGTAYSTQSWGAILAPFLVGLLADRYFHAERLLGVLHLAGAALMFSLARSANFSSFYPCLLAYMVLYMPTLALVNSISFRQLSDPATQFAAIRVWGTIGWIAVGLAISFVFAWDSPSSIAAGALRNTFLLCGAASLVLGMYSFTLPSTPPGARQADGADQAVRLRDLVGVDALRLLKNRNFLVFFVSSILICIPLAFYYQHANQFLTELRVANPTGKQTLGQMSEVLFMLLIPMFLKRFGMKTTLLVGMFAWAARYLLFAFGNSHGLVALLLVGIALHGVCYDFFFVSGQIFIDSKAGKEIKSAAQGLITLATYGAGMLIGFWAAGRITDAYALNGVHQWGIIWLYPAAFAALVFIFFALSFKNENVRYETQ
jgi:nucleoside transporter